MAGRQRNLEVKAIDPDPQATFAAALALGAQDHGVLHQRDTPRGLEVQRDRVEELRAALGITDERLVPAAYADLLAGRGRAA